MKSVEKLYQSGNTNFGLCLGLFSYPGGVPEEESVLSRYRSTYQNLDIITIKKFLPFEKAPALQQCLDSPQIKPDDIVFMVDVDVTFPVTVLQTIRRYVSQGTRLTHITNMLK